MPPLKRPIKQNRRDILRAFLILERETGRTAFKYSELRKQAQHINPSTLNNHIRSSMNDGKNHPHSSNEVETVGREGRENLYSLTSFGRQQVKDLGLDGH